MKPRSYSSTGIVLHKKNLGETDKIITIFSKDFGKITLLAKGVRTPKSRKRGHVEIFSNIKFHAVSGSSMDILTEAETVDNYKSVRLNLKKVSLAYYLCEVVEKITTYNEPVPEIYLLLTTTLKKLTNTKLLKNLRLEFVHTILVVTGYHPIDENMVDHDNLLSDVLERNINSERVGKRLLIDH